MTPNSKPQVIDCQWHWNPPAFFEAHLDRSAPPMARRSGGGFIYEASDEIWRFDSPRFHNLDFATTRMRQAGIDAAVISPPILGDLSDRELPEAIELTSLLNEEFAKAQARFPGVLHGLAVLPLRDTDAALSALQDATQRLGLKGVMLPANVAGESVADRRLWPVYEELERLGLPVFLHPTRCFRLPNVTPFNLERPVGYMFDTSFAMMSLIVSGLLDHVSGLKIVHPHVGGTLPFLAGRLEIYRKQGFWPGLDRPILDYLKRLYFDLVCDEGESLDLFGRVIGYDRLLFSSDYPYWSASKGVEFARRSIPAKHIDAVLGGNARQLMGIEGA